MGKWCPRIISPIFNWICSILAKNNSIHKNSVEFEIQPDLTTGRGVICPLAFEKIAIDLSWENGVHALTLLFLIRSSSFFHVTRTAMRSRLISEFHDILPWTAELGALEPVVRPSWSTISKIFFFETAWPIKLKFYVEPPWIAAFQV